MIAATLTSQLRLNGCTNATHKEAGGSMDELVGNTESTCTTQIVLLTFEMACLSTGGPCDNANPVDQ
eukprot:2603737-Amphidinium_carterae.1